MAARKNRRASQRRAQHLKQTKCRVSAQTTGLVDEMTDTLNLAVASWEQGRRDEALAGYERAVNEAPNNVRAYILTARAYADRYRLNDLEVILGKLRRLAPQHPGVHHFIGETYALMNQPDLAVAAYEKACELPGVQPGTWMELASLYERAHRLDEARALIERADKDGLRKPMLRLVQARIERREKQDEVAEQTLRKMIVNLPDDSEWAWQAHSEIALIKDKQGDYGGAIEAIERCKQSQLKHSAKKWEQSGCVIQRFQNMVDSLTATDFNRWQDESADLPDTRTAILAGFPRSGTTLLEQVLDAHGELVSSEERDFLGKEQFTGLQAPDQRVGPIMDVLNTVSTSRIRAEQKNYFTVMERLLGEPIAGRVHLDKNPAYNLFLPIVLRLFPQTSVLIALRDPRDVVLSCYLRYLPINPVSVWFQTIERTAQRYALDMKAWLKFREIIPNPWCEVRYEDSVADLEKQAKRALMTLGLPWDPAVMNYRERLGKERQVTSPTYEAVKQPVYTRSVGRWKNYEEQLAPTKDILAPFIKAFGYEL